MSPVIDVTAAARPADPAEMDAMRDGLDERCGVILASGVEYPGRYTRWDIGFIDPPLRIEGRGFRMRMEALNVRGEVPLEAFRDAVEALEGVTVTHDGDRLVEFEVASQRDDELPEEQRTRRRSTFTILRALLAAIPGDVEGGQHLGLYGAFGYDLVRQIEALEQIDRGEQRDLAVYLPDSILAVDRQRGDARRYDFEFAYGGRTTATMPRNPSPAPFEPAPAGTAPSRDHEPGEYAQLVRDAMPSFRRGDLFEVVPGQAFRTPVAATPATVFEHLTIANPAPYGAFMNLGRNEFLVSASPEMFVRVQGRDIETVPISGTIARGRDALEDADRIRTLLNSDKDRSELTMCTDVDRNDKSRVCEPGSVRIVGRRQIELYSKVIHTVDHVTGVLREEFDGLDAFATHMWAVTVTGAPKLWAMRFIDEHERSPRTWYGGAIGALFADGSVNTGLTIRTAMIRDGVAEVRAGGTLLIDSTPEDEEKETEMKASALLEALQATPETVAEARAAKLAGPPSAARETGAGHRILMLDHEDSFSQMLAGYLRETGAEVRTIRIPKGGASMETVRRELDAFDPTLAVMSPGPGSPSDFRDSELLAELDARGLAIFGVCLGQQAIGEHFGGALGQLGYPLHGKEKEAVLVEPGFLEGMPERFETGRYHSLYIDPATFPEELVLVASDDDGIPMAIQHRTKPIWAVQFHPESLMTLRDDAGRTIIDAVLARVPRR
ncbi:Anthranilate synthase component 1 [Pseudoclavibacter triregionum]|nr:Anthranilate synthase component 1 [Pseudoclavibacter triregionum]